MQNDSRFSSKSKDYVVKKCLCREIKSWPVKRPRWNFWNRRVCKYIKGPRVKSLYGCFSKYFNIIMNNIFSFHNGYLHPYNQQKLTASMQERRI